MLRATAALQPTSTIVVVGHMAESVEAAIAAPGIQTVRQEPQRGTAHALLQTDPVLKTATAGGPAAITSHVKAGKLRPLASWGAKRHEAYPDVPTFKELGYDIEYYIWAGMFAPRGTPEPVMKVLRDAARKAVEDPDFKTTMAKVSSPVHYLDAPEFAKYWAADAKRLAEVVKVVGKVEDQK